MAMREEAKCSGAERQRRPAGVQAVAQRFRHQGLGCGAAAHSRANAVWAGDRILQFRNSDIGVAVAPRWRAYHPGYPECRDKIVDRNFSRDEGSRGSRAAQEAQAKRISGRLERHLQSRHVWRARVFRHYQSAARNNSRRRRDCRAPIEAVDGGVKFISQMTVTLSCDHRVVDGELEAELLAAFKKNSSRRR